MASNSNSKSNSNSNNKDEQPTSPSTSSTNSTTTNSNIHHQQQGRRVRFDSDINSPNAIDHPQQRNRRPSAYSDATPPIAEEAEEDGDEPHDYFSIPTAPRLERQYSHPELYLTRPDSTNVVLSSDEESFEQRPSQQQIIHGGGVLDVGMYTSAGLAPGARTFETAANEEEQPERELARRREVLLRSLENESAASSPTMEHSNPMVSGSGSGNGMASPTEDIPLQNMNEKHHGHRMETDIARKLVRSHTAKRQKEFTTDMPDREFEFAQEPSDTVHETPQHEDYVPQGQVKQGVLSSLLKLYAEEELRNHNLSVASSTTDLGMGTNSSTLVGSPTNSGTPTSDIGSPMGSAPVSRRSSTSDLLSTVDGTPKRPKWYKHKKNLSTYSTHSLGSMLIGANQTFAAPGAEHQGHQRPKFHKRPSASNILKRRREKEAKAAKNRITVHIAGVLQRQRFILRICRALMMYGAPTHRLEEYLKMTSRVLEISGQYLYIPGCMIVSFDDAMTHTSEMRLIRCVQGLNLSKLHETHQIYKEVVHDVIGVEEASIRIDNLLASKNRYPEWLCVIFYGLASMFVTPWAFGGWWTDLPVNFLIGSAVGISQVVVAPRSDLYSNVFEVTSSIVVSFIGRAIGSIYRNGEPIFCFASIAGGSLALILPGYIILCGSLELQSKNIVSGSVRMFYAIIYSLFLGFGITLGATIYGWIDGNATSQTSCQKAINPWFWFLFIPLFATFIAQVNQANIRQLPSMILIASAGYAVSYFIKTKVSGSAEFVSAIGAFVIGILGNLYSRIGHGLAFAAMLPAIFTQVPNGVASQGSVVQGITNADLIVSNGTKPHTTVLAGGAIVTVTPTPSANNPWNSSTATNLGITMVQVSIGITVGLFVATLCIYPFGKKRSGLFTF